MRLWLTGNVDLPLCCQYGLDRIFGEEKSLALLAQAMDPHQPAMMTDVVKLLSAICIVGEENTYVYTSTDQDNRLACLMAPKLYMQLQRVDTFSRKCATP